MADTGNSIQLPALMYGAHVVGATETSQTMPTGIIQQGVRVVVQLASGNTTTVFVPYVQLTDTAAVVAAINDRVGAIQAIESL